MPLKKISRWSIQTKTSLLVLAIFVLGLWSLAYYINKLLHEDMERQLGNWQFSTASILATTINDELNERLNALKIVARMISPDILNHTPSMQKFLEEQPVLQNQFNAGLFTVQADGVATASTPLSLGRTGTNFLHRNHVAAALKEGKTIVSDVVIGIKLQTPVVSIASPIFDAQGKIIGALVGVTDLSKPNFLDSINNHAYGKTGGYRVVSPKQRLVVTSNDKSLVMLALPAPGINPTMDLFLQGFEGTKTFINPKNVKVLTSIKKIPVADWFLAVVLPTEEAFAPIHAMTRHLIIATLALTLLACGLVWWTLKRQLSPLINTAKTLAALSHPDQHLQPLPITHQGEVGQLITGFNRLLETLAQREAQIKSEEKFKQNILDSVTDEIVVINHEGIIQAVNQSWRNFAMENSAEPGKPVPNTDVGSNYFTTHQSGTDFSSESAAQAFAGIQAVIDGRRPLFTQEYPCNSPQHPRWFHMSVTSLGENAQDWVVIMHTDITERKLAELNLIRNEAWLSDSQILAKVGSWEVNLTNYKTLWSTGNYKTFDVDPEHFQPTYEAFLNLIYPDDREKVETAFTESLDNKTPNIVEHRIVTNQGILKYVEERWIVYRNDQGQPVRAVGTCQDITEHKQTELALQAARDEANRANRAKSKFLTSMSHELRTPMNAVLGFSQLMEMNIGGTLSETHKTYVKSILISGNHLMDLIKDVLDLAKIEANVIQLSLETVDVCYVVDECLALTSVLADSRHIQLSHSGLEGMAVRADRTRLKQAMLNLISNAIKYNREGGSVLIRTAYYEPNRLHIMVTDTGPGITADQMDRLFEPFNRLGREGSNIVGTGIGLTITRRLVEMMEGTVDVVSVVGVGSTFRIDLPLESLNNLPSAPHPEIITDTAIAKSGTEIQHTVLYIEDNPLSLNLVEQLFSQRPHIHLITAHTPSLGIELATAHHPTLILLDINMPEMDGYQVLQILKHEPNLKLTPVIAVTANAMSSDIQDCMVAGFTDYVAKPIDVKEFLKLIDKYLPDLQE